MNGNSEKKYFEILTQNAQIGESYFIKLRHDPNIYLGIPIIHSNFNSDDDNNFTLKVLEPKEKEGIFERTISDIEFLEKR